MVMTVLWVSILLTVGVLVLSLITIQKGYGYKHTIDPPVENNPYDSAQSKGATKK